MNLILTTSCNKGCSFCFAKDVLDKSEMSLDDVKNIVKKMTVNNNISLLGGEPTNNSNFVEILSYLKTLPNKITLISNFIFGEKILNSIIDFISEKNLGFLINVSEVSQQQFDLTSENMLLISKYTNANIRLGYTINLDYDFKYYEDNLNKYKEKLGDVFSRARISLPFPNPKDTNSKMYFFNNYEYIDRIIDFVNWGIKNKVKFNLDCGIYPCMIKDNTVKTFLLEWLEGFKYGCENGIPVDILNPSEVQYCYPGENIRVDMDKHSLLNTVENELFLRKRLAYSTQGLPEECKKCCFLFKECPGPCLGFLKKEI